MDTSQRDLGVCKIPTPLNHLNPLFPWPSSLIILDDIMIVNFNSMAHNDLISFRFGLVAIYTRDNLIVGGGSGREN